MLHVQPPVRARVLVGKPPLGAPRFSQSIVLRARMLRSSLFGRLVMWIFCRGTIAVFAEKKTDLKVVYNNLCLQQLVHDLCANNTF